MARSRNLKPGFFTNDLLGECDPFARLLFAGLWTQADREGRLLDRPRKLKAELFPYDDVDAEGLLRQLTERGFIVRYQAEGEALIQIVNWMRHQRPHQSEPRSELPPPPDAPPEAATAPDPAGDPPASPPHPAGDPPSETAHRPGNALDADGRRRTEEPNVAPGVPLADGRGTQCATPPDHTLHVASSGSRIPLTGSRIPDTGSPPPDPGSPGDGTARRRAAVEPAAPAPPPPRPRRARSCPKSSRCTEVVAAIQAVRVPVELSGRDVDAINQSGAPPTEIAAAYVAMYRGEWGDEFDRSHVSVHRTIEHLAGYRAMQAPSPPLAAPVDPPREIQTATDEDRVVWGTALRLLEGAMTRTNFDTWLVPTRVLGWDGSTLVVGAPSEAVRDSLQTRLRLIVRRALRDVAPAAEDVAFVLDRPAVANRAPPAVAPAPIAIAQ